MFKKKILIFVAFLIISSVSCNAQNSTTYDSYVFNIDNEIYIDSINKNIPHKIIPSSEIIAVLSLSESALTSSIYSLDSGALINVIEITYDELNIRDCDISNDYFVCLGREPETNKISLITYNLSDFKKNIITISDDINLLEYENMIQIQDDKILVNLYTGYLGEGYSYLISASSPTSIKLLTTYDISNYIMDGSLEEICGGVNQISGDKIIMSSIDFVQSNNGVDVYSIDDGLLDFSSTEYFSESDSCNVLNADVIGNYVSLKMICSDNENKFYVFDIEDKDILSIVDFPYVVDDFRVKAVNEDYIIFTDSNWNQIDSKIMYFDITQNTLYEIENPNNDIDYYGSEIYMNDDVLCIYNSRTENLLLAFNLRVSTFIDIQYEFTINEVYGKYKQFLIFEVLNDQNRELWGYNIQTNEFILVIDNSLEEYELEIFADYIMIAQFDVDNSISIVREFVSN